VPPGLSQDLRALALVSLGSAEVWTTRLEEAHRHLEEGVALARRNGRPFLEFTGLVHQAVIDIYRSSAQAAERSRQPIELARRHGWTDEPAAGTAYSILGTALVWQGRPEEAEPWVQRAERTVRAEAEPATAVGVLYVRGLLELARGRDADALAAFRAAEQLAGNLTAPHLHVPPTRGLLLLVLVRLGEIERAEQAIGDLGESDRERGETRTALAALQLARDDPHAAIAALAPRSPATHSATPRPPSGPWSARSIWLSPKACCCSSCSSPRRACWSGTPSTAPHILP
jgi:LuxR family maltose regulon positive regulatory protein